MPKGILVEKYTQLNGHRGPVYTLALAGIQHHVYSAGSDGIVALWDMQNAKSAGAAAKVPTAVFALYFDAHTHFLWIGREDGGIHLIDTILNKEIGFAHLHTKGVFSIVKCAYGIATSGGDGTIVLWHADKLQAIYKAQISDKKIRSLTVVGNHFFASAADGNIHEVQSISGNIIRSWVAHEKAANTLAVLAPNIIITGGWDARLKIWDISLEQPLLLDNIAAHNYAIYKIEMLPEQGILVTCSRDKTLKIWNPDTVALMQRLNHVHGGGHRNSVNDFVFLPENGILVSAGDDGALMGWTVDTATNTEE